MSINVWMLFLLSVVIMLVIDLGIFQRHAHKPSLKEAGIWSLVWFTIALLFNGLIYLWQGQEAALTFLTAYLLEKSLSLDNLFVFIMIFNFFSTPPHLQHRVLHWGIIGAIVLRFILITAGIKLIEQFEWLLYGAGLFLIYSSVVLLRQAEGPEKPAGEKIIKFLQKKIAFLPDDATGHFFRRQHGQWFMTPLFLVLVSIEFSDLIFALDSIPAVFAITRDPFLVFTSNIFAILGLRSLYFLLADILPRFYYLKHALSIILGFIGLKMLFGHYLGVSNLFSLGFIALTLGGSLILSLRKSILSNLSLYRPKTLKSKSYVKKRKAVKMYQRTEDQGVFIKNLHYFYRRSETAVVENLLQQVKISPEQKQNIQKHASRLIQSIRHGTSKAGVVGQMMHQFPLGTSEGLLLMSLAESLLRIPDTSTREALLRDKLSQANFKKYFISSTPWLMKLSTRGFDFAATLLKEENQTTPFKKELTKFSLPVIRYVAKQAMNLLAHKFIFAQTIEAALKISSKNQPQGYTHSFDMLGEAALTETDAERYFNDYLKAIEHLGQVNTAQNTTSESTFNLFVKRDNISIKLSALHPRYSYAQEDRVMTELSEKLLKLCQAAQQAQISLTIDAEESERLEISLNLIEQMITHPTLKEWEGLGLAVQAYQKRATQVIDNAVELAQRTQKRLSLRLVKGAYWDTEIKKCQELGLEDYPVFTRKESTDISYLVCAQKMLSRCDVIFPQFATHNALTVATIMAWAPDPAAYEFQKLHVMGDELYQALMQDPVLLDVVFMHP